MILNNRHTIVDVSKVVASAVIKQLDENCCLAFIPYYSIALSSYEKQYFITEIEFLVIAYTNSIHISMN